MATPRTPSREPGSSYSLTSSLSPRRTQYTFSTQRAEFTKPVPAALMPVYPTFAQDSDSDDESSIANTPSKPTVMPQGSKSASSVAERNSQTRYQGIDTMATVGQATLVRGFAEKSGISPTSNIRNLRTSNFDSSPGEIDDTEVQQKSSNSFKARLASLLGRQKRQERRSPSNAIPSPTEVPLSALSYSNDLKCSPLPSPLQFESLRPDSSLSPNNSLNAMGHRNTNMPAVTEDGPVLTLPGQAKASLKQRRLGQGSSYTSATYPPFRSNRFLRHHRSRSLGISIATNLHTPNQASLSTFAQGVPSPDLRSRSMDDQRSGKTTRVHGNFLLSSHHIPLVSIPPNCVLVQVCAVGLDGSDRQLVMGSDGYSIDEAHSLKRSREKCKESREEEGTYSFFNGSELLGWSLVFGLKKKKEVGWLAVPSVKPPATPNRQTIKRMVRGVSLPKTLESGCIPGQSFVGRVLGVGSVVEKSFVARDDWVVGLADIGKCGPLAEYIVIDWRQVHRVPTPYEPCSLDNETSTGSTLVSELPSGKPTEDEGKPPLPQFAQLAFDELALLPLCGIPAYRAVKTCIDAFPAGDDNFNGGAVLEGLTGDCSHPIHGQRRRALVLRGHDGVGAMVVQMLVRQGWRVSVHVPFSRVPWDASQAEADGFMLAIEDRLKKWGADEVIYDDGISYNNWDGEMDDRRAAVVRVIDTLRGDGDVFDAVLDLVGGKDIREASERLLRLNGCPGSHGFGQITTILGANVLDDPIPTLADHFRSNLANPSTSTLPYAYERAEVLDSWSGDMGRRVKHTVIEGAFESEEEEVWEILGSVLQLALEDGIRPHVEAGGELFGRRRSVSLEQAYDVLVDGDLLSDGGTVVVRVVR